MNHKRTSFTVITILLFLVIGSLECLAQKINKGKWKEIDGVAVPVPPSEHPRLYIRSSEIPELQKRKGHPKLKPLWDQMIKAGKSEFTEEDRKKMKLGPKGVQARMEVAAVNYLINPDAQVGRKIIDSTLQIMEVSEWPYKSHSSREIGRLMVTGAVVYDWCYKLLTDSQKKRFIEQFMRLAAIFECGYPPYRGTSITGHEGEVSIMRDLLSVGIAIYDDFPEIYDYTAGRFFKEMLPARNWFYISHAYNQGTGYDNVRFFCDLFPLWIYDKLGFPNIYNASQQFVPYNQIYKRRGDGQYLAGGDMNSNRGKRATMGRMGIFLASYYKDGYVYNEVDENSQIDIQDKLFEFLWRDPNLKQLKPDNLPLTRYFGQPFGWMIARTGWDEQSVVAEMKINEYNFLNHQHQDAGTFQIYYKGPLAIDAGAYTGSSGGYLSPHNKNYFKRTIAHNSLLIYDPKETFFSVGYADVDIERYAVNDGGQRLPGYGWNAPKNLHHMWNTDYKTGVILAQGVGPEYQTPEYSYLKGDITEAYSSKVKQVKRSFLFLNLKNSKIPAALIVFDKVISANPSYKKFWLLHSIEEPEIKGNQISIKRTKNGDTGMLVNTTLLPDLSNADIISVGGKGKECWVFGTNYPQYPNPNEDIALERGEWRVEITPKKPAAEDLYLNVMQITDIATERIHDIRRIDGEKIIGVQIADRVSTFSKSFETIDQAFNLSVKGEGTFKFVVTDLLSGVWQVMKDGEVFRPAILVRSDDGILSFEGPAGEYRFLR